MLHTSAKPFLKCGEYAMYNKIYIEVSNICNMRCSFCHGHSRAPRQMSKEEFESILCKLTKHTKYIYYHLMGEPLTHPQLPELVNLAGRYGYKSVITTNGTLLSERGDALLEAGVHKVNISLHSFEGGADEDYVKYLTAAADFAKKAADLGTIANFRFWNIGFDCGKNEFAMNILKERITGDWTPNTRGIRVRNKIYIEMDDRFEWPDSAADIKGTRFSCHGLKDHFGILVDGTVVPCCLDSDGVIDLGNIFRQDVETILSSQRAQNMLACFRCGQAAEDLCRRCGYAQRFVH